SSTDANLVLPTLSLSEGMKAALPEATSAISVPPSSRVVETRRTSICLCWRCFPREGGVKAERIYHPPRKRGDGGLTSEYQRAICANWSKAAWQVLGSGGLALLWMSPRYARFVP